MKFKKTMAAVAAAVTAFTMCATTLTACNKCDHKYAWTTITEATCTTEGLEQGVCGICGDVTTNPIPKSDDHPYGEWEITVPTEQTEGKAVKVCTADSTHTLEVTLPKITADGTGYDSSDITKPATSVSKGERTYVLNHEAGDIKFIVYTPEKEVETVEDAVLIGASNKALIRSVSGVYSTDTVRYNPNDYMYEFGENYMHISESGDQTEIFCSLDENGNAYVIKTETGKPLSQDVSASPEYMNGFLYTLGYSSSTTWYGLESLLSGLYSWGRENVNKDFKESVGLGSGGDALYKFQFGTHSAKYYSDIYVEFTLTDSYAIKTLTVNTDVYDGASWDLDEETELAKPVTPNPDGHELITATTVLRTPEDEIPENPYTIDNFSVKSFELYNGSTEVTDETVTKLSANALYTFNVKNVKHMNEEIEGNIAFDPLTYFLRTEDGDIPISFEAGNDGISMWTTNNTNINIRSYKTGELTIVISTQSGNFEKLLKLNVSKIAPPVPSVDEGATFYPSVYLFGGERYYWQSLATATTEQMAAYAKTFVGQELKFKADVPQALLSYVDPSATAVLDSVTGATVDDAEIKETDEENVYSFTATKPGVYRIKLTSKLSSARFIYLPITVEERPDISTVLIGQYEGHLEYPTPNEVTVKFNSNGATTGTLEVTLGTLGTETLSYSWDGERLTTTYLYGAHDASQGFGFTVALNQAYNVVITHPSGVGEETETLVLYKN